MLESLNAFFATTYIYNKAFYAIQLLAVISLMGIGLGLTSRMLFKGWKSVRSKLQVNK